MHLKDKFVDRQDEPVTPDVIREIIKEFKDTFWWVRVRGKCYSPYELMSLITKCPGLKIGELKQVDPRQELNRANEVLVKMHERRIDFEKRVNEYILKVKGQL